MDKKVLDSVLKEARSNKAGTQRNVDLKQRKVFFCWIGKKGDLYTVQSLDETLKEIDFLTNLLEQENDRLAKYYFKNMEEDKRQCECKGAFVVIYNPEKGKVKFTPPYESAYEFIQSFNECNNDAICIPVHLNLDSEYFPFECQDTSLIEDLFKLNGVREAYMFAPHNLAQLDRCKINRFTFDFATDEIKVLGKDIDELCKFIGKTRGLGSLIVYAHLKDYYVPYFYATFNQNDVDKVLEYMYKSMDRLQDYMDGTLTIPNITDPKTGKLVERL